MIAPPQQTSDAMASPFGALPSMRSLNAPDEPHAAGDERKLQIEVRIGQRLRRIANQQADAGDEVQPEAEPHRRQKPPHLGNRHVRRDAENAKRDRRVDAGSESHADRVRRENAGEGKERRRSAHPFAGRRRLEPGEETHRDLAVGRLQLLCYRIIRLRDSSSPRAARRRRSLARCWSCTPVSARSSVLAASDGPVMIATYCLPFTA